MCEITKKIEVHVEGYQCEPDLTKDEFSLFTCSECQRGMSLDWCTCGNFTILPTVNDCLSCNEFDDYVTDYINSDTKCISSAS